MHHSIKRNYILVFYNYQTMNIHQIQYNCVVCGVIRVCTDNHCMYFFYLGFLERIITSKKVTAIYFYNVGCILVKLKLHIMTESTWIQRRYIKRSLLSSANNQNNDACALWYYSFEREFIVQDSLNIYQLVCKYTVIIILYQACMASIVTGIKVQKISLPLHEYSKFDL